MMIQRTQLLSLLVLLFLCATPVQAGDGGRSILIVLTLAIVLPTLIGLGIVYAVTAVCVCKRGSPRTALFTTLLLASPFPPLGAAVAITWLVRLAQPLATNLREARFARIAVAVSIGGAIGTIIGIGLLASAVADPYTLGCLETLCPPSYVLVATVDQTDSGLSDPRYFNGNDSWIDFYDITPSDADRYVSESITAYSALLDFRLSPVRNAVPECALECGGRTVESGFAPQSSSSTSERKRQLTESTTTTEQTSTSVPSTAASTSVDATTSTAIAATASGTSSNGNAEPVTTTTEIAQTPVDAGPVTTTTEIAQTPVEAGPVTTKAEVGQTPADTRFEEDEIARAGIITTSQGVDICVDVGSHYYWREFETADSDYVRAHGTFPPSGFCVPHRYSGNKISTAAAFLIGSIVLHLLGVVVSAFVMGRFAAKRNSVPLDDATPQMATPPDEIQVAVPPTDV